MNHSQFEKNISVTLRHIERKLGAIANWKAKGDADWVVSLNCEIVTAYLEIALFRWRHGDDPRSDLAAGLDWANKAIAEMQEWPPTSEQVDRINWEFAQTMGYIAGRDLALPFALDAAQTPHDAVDRLLAEALYDRPYRDALAEPMSRLAAKKLFAEPHKSYCTYFAVLDAYEKGEELTPLIEEAEANYKIRKRFQAGQGYQGWGFYNDYVLDWQLAALIKKTGWGGDSIHRWTW
jgi:hypothetical protein